MRLATMRVPGGTTAVTITDGIAQEIRGIADVGALLRRQDWMAVVAAADGEHHPVDKVADPLWAPPILAPSKIICVGLNYKDHILEMGRVFPEYPTLFAKYPEALIGPYDTIIVPRFASYALDWEAELAIVIGSPARMLSQPAAHAAIAGYTALNDISLRDYQNRTPEWLQGKTLEGSCPIGPVVATADEYSFGTEITTLVDGELKQRSTTDNLVFEPAELVSYISQIVTLNPGDIIATGTPGGVGDAQTPPVYLRDGSVVTTSIEGIGTLRNSVRFLP